MLVSIRLSDSDVQVISGCLRFGISLYFLLVISNAYTFLTQYNCTVFSARYLVNETYCIDCFFTCVYVHICIY